MCGGMDGLYSLQEVSISFVWWYGWPLLTVYRKCLSPLCGGMDGLYSLQEPSLQSLSPTYGSMNVFFLLTVGSVYLHGMVV